MCLQLHGVGHHAEDANCYQQQGNRCEVTQALQSKFGSGIGETIEGVVEWFKLGKDCLPIDLPYLLLDGMHHRARVHKGAKQDEPAALQRAGNKSHRDHGNLRSKILDVVHDSNDLKIGILRWLQCFVEALCLDLLSKRILIAEEVARHGFIENRYRSSRVDIALREPPSLDHMQSQNTNQAFTAGIEPYLFRVC